MTENSEKLRGPTGIQLQKIRATESRRIREMRNLFQGEPAIGLYRFLVASPSSAKRSTFCEPVKGQNGKRQPEKKRAPKGFFYCKPAVVGKREPVEKPQEFILDGGKSQGAAKITRSAVIKLIPDDSVKTGR